MPNEEALNQRAGLSKRALAAIDLLRRTGSSTFEIRYSEDNEPLVWMAITGWVVNKKGRPIKTGTPNRYEAAAALMPEDAIFRLCDLVIDGGTCLHCSRPTGFVPDIDPMPLSDLICWYQYDPELNTFRRSCEGE